jgi:hypothetical protein
VRLHEIKRLLQAGIHPTDFGGKLIGDGAQRPGAFLVGDYVCKHIAPAWQHDADANDDNFKPVAPRWRYAVPRSALKRIGIEPPEQHVVGGWVVQLYYRPLNKTEMRRWKWLADAEIAWRNITLDVFGNIGVHVETGRVHAYDW